MLHVHITAEQAADEYGPHERYVERFVLPSRFASDAAEAHARLLTLIVTERYFEVPRHEGGWPIPLRSETVRRMAVRRQ